MVKPKGQKFQKKFLTTVDKSGVEKKMTVFLKKMSNYFSFGVDARIGYGIILFS